MARGQKWGTVGLKEGVVVGGAWMTRAKHKSFRELAKRKGLTMSSYINKLISLELIKAGIDDPSLSVELG